MEDESVLRSLVAPQHERLALGIVDAVAGRPVEVQTHVQAVLDAELDGPVHLLHRPLFDFVHVVRRERPGFAPVRVDPKPVVHGNADEIEAPIANPLQIVLADHPRTPLSPVEGLEEVDQVESSPSGNRRLGRLASGAAWATDPRAAPAAAAPAVFRNTRRLVDLWIMTYSPEETDWNMDFSMRIPTCIFMTCIFLGQRHFHILDYLRAVLARASSPPGSFRW